MPVVNGGMILHPGVRTGPGRIGDIIPQVPGFDGFNRPGLPPFGLRISPFNPTVQRPLLIADHGLHKTQRRPHRVVGVLSGHGIIRLGIPVRIIGREFDACISQFGQLDNPFDIFARYLNPLSP